MLEIHSIIHNVPVYSCSFCQFEIDLNEAINHEWRFCPHCGRELWNSYNDPWR